MIELGLSVDTDVSRAQARVMMAEAGIEPSRSHDDRDGIEITCIGSLMTRDHSTHGYAYPCVL